MENCNALYFCYILEHRRVMSIYSMTWLSTCMFLFQRWQLCFINEEFKNDNGEKWYEEDCGFFSEKEEPLTVWAMKAIGI